MKTKPDLKKDRKSEAKLSPEESQELEMIVDRLAVQNAEGASLENYLKSLVKALAGRENLAAAIIDRVARKPSKVGFLTFSALKQDIHDKKLARIIKQAGYRFSQRGFSPEPETTPVDDVMNVVLVQKEGRKPIAHVLPVDGTFWLFAALIPQAGYPAPALVTALMEQDFARVYVRLFEGSQKIYKDYLRKVGERHADRIPCEVPVHHVARLFFEMVDLSADKEVTAEINRAGNILKPFYDPEKPPYAYNVMPAIEDPEERLGDVKTGELLSMVDWSWLIFPKQELSPYRLRMQELKNPVLVVPPEVQEERLSDLLKQASDALCSEKARWLYQRFFEEQALWLKLSSRDDPAMSAWIIAQHLRSGAPASKNPVVGEMVMISMQQHWSEDFEEKRQPKEPFSRTESGLIVPS
jgi:hypothetical protein